MSLHCLIEPSKWKDTADAEALKEELQRKMNLWSNYTLLPSQPLSEICFPNVNSFSYKNSLAYNASIGHRVMTNKNRLLLPLTRLKIAPH